MSETVKGNRLPDLTVEQRQAALEKAMAVRKENARLVDAIRTGKVSFAAALDDPAYARIRIRQLLLAVPGVGRSRCRVFFSEGRIDPERRVGGLGCRQRTYLLEQIASVEARRKG